MEAPEKIYLTQLMLFAAPTISSSDNDIEYIRTDVFIEKACKLLARMIQEVTYEDFEVNSVQHYNKIEFIEDFKKYMEENKA